MLISVCVCVCVCGFVRDRFTREEFVDQNKLWNCENWWSEMNLIDEKWTEKGKKQKKHRKADNTGHIAVESFLEKWITLGSRSLPRCPIDLLWSIVLVFCLEIDSVALWKWMRTLINSGKNRQWIHISSDSFTISQSMCAKSGLSCSDDDRPENHSNDKKKIWRASDASMTSFKSKGRKLFLLYLICRISHCQVWLCEDFGWAV